MLFPRLHDRKICVLGLCALIDLEQRPQAVNQVAGQLLPAAILLFNGLKRAYACQAENENEDEDDDEDGEEDEENGTAFVLPSELISPIVTPLFNLPTILNRIRYSCKGHFIGRWFELC